MCRFVIDDQIERFEYFFQRRDVSFVVDDGDNNEGGDYWELKDLFVMISWIVFYVLYIFDIVFVYIFRGKYIFLFILFDEKVKEVVYENIDVVYVYCEMIVGELY